MNDIDLTRKEIEELKIKKEFLKTEIEMKQKEIENFEIDLNDDEFIDILDGIYGDVTICGYSYSAGRTLLEIDPIAFRCGKNDYENGMDVTESKEYQEIESELEELENELDSINEDLENAIEELEELESELENN